MTAAVTRWWWLRHAPTADAPGTIHGRRDVPAALPDAPACAALAARLPTGALWLASPLMRARATAEALADGSPVGREEAFAEQDFGAWQGLAWDAVPAAEQRAFWRTPAEAAPPGGESFAAVCARVARAVAAIEAREGARDVVAVAHAGTIRAALVQALGAAPPAGLAFAVDCLSLTRIDSVGGRDGGGRRIVAVNLPAPLGTQARSG